MFQKTILAFRVFRHSLLIVSLLLTMSFVLIIYSNADSENISLPILIIGRVIIFAPILYLFCKIKSNIFIYYRNLGLPKFKLLIYIYIFDAVSSIIILNLCYAIIK